MGETPEVNRSRIIRKFERFMESVRSDNNKRNMADNLKEEPKVIGYFTYDFENKTETYTSTNKPQ